jgi:hypothetical protein
MIVRIKFSAATLFRLTSTSFLSHKVQLVHQQHYQHYIRPPCFYNRFSKAFSSMDKLGDLCAAGRHWISKKVSISSYLVFDLMF